MTSRQVPPLEKLISGYPGQYRGADYFAGAADRMQSQMGSAYSINRQNLTWNNGNRTLQNVVEYAEGTKAQRSFRYLLRSPYPARTGRQRLGRQCVDKNGEKFVGAP